MQFEKTTDLPFSVNEVFDWHMRAGAFRRLCYPGQGLKFLSESAPISEGIVNEFLVPLLGPISKTWVARHHSFVKNEQFIDEQISGPFWRWHHTHRFLPTKNSATSQIHDRIEITPPLAILGELFSKQMILNELERNFFYRDHRLKFDLSLHAQFRDQKRLKIGITGASGVLGTQLSAFLSTGGHEVFKFVRRPTFRPDEIYWNPDKGEINAPKVKVLDAVIHLAGENVGSGKWTPEKMKIISSSRNNGTKLIASTIAKMEKKPVLISASAIGYYGDTEARVVDEKSPMGELFLSKVCREWEDANKVAEDAGVRVVKFRIGVVLTPWGGALKELMRPFKFGLGATIGSGEQYFSWVSLDDVISAIYTSLFKPEWRDVINLVSPEPVTSAEFSHTLASVLSRPCLFNIPSFAIRMGLGEMGEEVLLKGQRVRPTRLMELGHCFAFRKLENLLDFELL